MANSNVNDMWAGFVKWSEDSLRGVARAIGWAPPAPGPAPTPSPSATRATSAPLKMTLKSDGRTAFILGSPVRTSAITGAAIPESPRLSDGYGEYSPGDRELGPPDPRHVAPPPPPPWPPSTSEIAQAALTRADRSISANAEFARVQRVQALRLEARQDAENAMVGDPEKGRVLAQRAIDKEREASVLETAPIETLNIDGTTNTRTVSGIAGYGELF